MVDAAAAVAVAVDIMVDMVGEAVVTAGTVTARIITTEMTVGPIPTITMVAATAMSTRQARMDELDRMISLSSPPMRVVLARLLNLRQVILGIVVDRMEIAAGITALSFLILLYFCDIRNLM